MGADFQRISSLQSVRWYLRYGRLSYRDLEEMLEERGVEVDHTSIFRWVIRLTPELEAAFKKRKAPVGGRWRLDETYIKVRGQWTHLYREVDKAGHVPSGQWAFRHAARPRAPLTTSPACTRHTRTPG